MARYQWANPHEWLESRITTAIDNKDITDLASLARELYAEVDGDTIQDMYQADMDKDGYFNDLDAVAQETI